jgi:tRNA pseudouridine55 synthase
MTHTQPNEEGEVILIDKPYRWTSFDVVKKVRNLLRIKKIGHAGTLDPLATGLLILCTGKKTKQIESYQGMEKEYEGELLLGRTTPSIDLETEFDAEYDISHIDESMLHAAARELTGVLQQIPPIYSAVRQDGERLYKKARRGEQEQATEIKSREVTVYSFELTSVDMPKVTFRIRCSKGTYIRSLVRDFGKELGAGACMTALRRTKIGEFDVQNARQISSFAPINQNPAS